MHAIVFKRRKNLWPGSAYERYREAEQEVELARQLEEGERAKFTLGDSTVFM